MDLDPFLGDSFNIFTPIAIAVVALITSLKLHVRFLNCVDWSSNQTFVITQSMANISYFMHKDAGCSESHAHHVCVRVRSAGIIVASAALSNQTDEADTEASTKLVQKGVR